MDVSEGDGYAGVYLAMDPWDSMVPEKRHRLYFLHMAPAYTHKLYGSNLTQAECLDVLGEASDVARFCNNVLLGLTLEDFILPSDHSDVQKARNQIQQKLDAPPPVSRKAAGRTPGSPTSGPDSLAELLFSLRYRPSRSVHPCRTCSGGSVLPGGRKLAGHDMPVSLLALLASP